MTRHVSIQAMLARRDRLDAADEARVAAHLAVCPECRERAADYTAQVTFLRSFRREVPPPGAREELLTMVDQRSTAGGKTSGHGPSGHRLMHRIAHPPLRATLRSTLRWPGVALTALLAVAVVVLSPLVNQRTASPVNAEAVRLLRSAAQAVAPLPSRGTATFSYLAPENSLVSDHVVPHRTIIRWSASDAQHYRIEVQTVEPAIDGGTLTVSQDGSRLTQYDTRSGTAIVKTSTLSTADLSTLVGPGLPMGGVSPDQSIQQYLVSTQQDLPSSVPRFARILGTERLLGRTVDEVQFAPVMRGIQCLPTRVKDGIWQGFKDCNTPLDSGTATLWIDDATHLILKYQLALPQSDSNVRDSRYQVTSLTLGQGAAPAALAQQLPAAVRLVTYLPPATYGQGAPPGVELPAPPGFLAARAPAALRNAASSMDIVAVSPPGFPALATGLNILFYAQASATTTSPYTPGEHFLSIEERIRVSGLPPELRAGTPAQAGTCQAWSGTSVNGLHTLAFARGTISVLMTSDSLSLSRLVSYAARAMCT